MLKNAQGYTLDQIAEYLNAELSDRASASLHITGIATLSGAGPDQISFLSRPDYAHYLAECRAAAVIVSEKLSVTSPVAILKVKNPYLAYAQLSAFFDKAAQPEAGVHATAVVDPSVRLPKSVHVGAHSVIEAGVVVGEGCVIGAGCFIGAGVQLGSRTALCPRVTLYHGVTLGEDVLVHSGAVIGADGFGFAPKPTGGWQKIHQLGGVRIGNRVEIGANTTIDRGALDDTVIEDGVIIDNQVQIAHNVHIGKNTAIAGCAAVAGSTRIGSNCTIAGGVGIVGHLTIADGVHITAMTLVTGSIDQAGSYSSGTNLLPTRHWRRSAVRFGQLDEIVRRLKALEKDD